MGPEKTIVVVVDGDCQVLKSLGDLLASAGYDARLFSSADEFLVSPGIGAAGCLICAIDLSGVTGNNLMCRIKARGMELPGILLTDRNDPDTVLFCRTGGAKFLFSKPILGPELLAAVALVANRLGVSRRIGTADSLVGRAVGHVGTFLGRQVFAHAYSALFRSAASANRPT